MLVRAMRTLIHSGQLLWADGRIAPGDLLLADGFIAEVAERIEPTPHAERFDAAGLTIAPGFIDLHVHGGGGFSLITRDPGETADYARWVAANGVTSFLASLCAGGLQEALEFVRAAAQVGRVEGGANMLGIHLEGPFLSAARRGALPAGWPLAPDVPTLVRILEAADGELRLMTLAPELPGAEAVLRVALDAGVVVAVGHTDASFEQAGAAFEAGASHVTHAFNAMRPWHHREPGPLGAALRANATIEVIADGVHLHPATVRLLAGAFGPDRVCLVTDAVAPAGLAEGSFRIGGSEARLRDGRMQLPDGTIAGSVATMDQLVRNAAAWAVTLAEALRMVSATPARALGLGDRKGTLGPGLDADIVALDGDLGVAATWVGGVPVFRR